MHDGSRLPFLYMTERSISVSGLPGLKRTRTLPGIQPMQNRHGRFALRALDRLRGYSLNHPNGGGTFV
jgi:hypothetical protein